MPVGTYVDLYLVHFPRSFPPGVSVVDAWRVREDQRGWIGQVGIIIAARGCSADIVTK